ncbi:ASKHA domain-containing protein [Thiovibrio frasassiensis]|uniref:ASKHA domain-containing protein n=1 Tax=Thiovibrio frasassiensis TaxID=2984131 RepID=A0A9X4RL47_9BACT|nr:ASKHA domain-containing protein [Thiovibrio frasassiensis]MDG4474698.1 ASKHA domain-containing protein [Thiovibrio frasassiensis]
MLNALVHTIPVAALPPSLGDNTGDLDRLKKALAPHLNGAIPVVPYHRLAKVAGRFRAAGFQGSAIINVLPGPPVLVDFLPQPVVILAGMALDLGTTHLEATLLDLGTGAILARADLENGQIRYGADILTRIHHAAKDEGLAELHRAIIDSVNQLAAELAGAAGLAVAEIRALSVSGNTSMVHFFLKINPYHLCREPYIPMVNAPDPCLAGELNLAIHPAAPVWLLPSVGSYFGGDLISGVLASGLDQQTETCMLIDVGTNAEVIVGNREWLIACAGAAGPALEGGVARMGMRAGPGAIEHVRIDPDSGEIRYETIGKGKPKGLCGSGLIDLVAELYLTRQIDIRGKFRPQADGDRLIPGSDGYQFVVVPGKDSADGQPVVLGQVDLDALMRSKAAMYAILTTLTNQVGVAFVDLHRIYVAGAFGRHISPRQAIVLGMLPDLPLATYEPVGNSSLAGAQRILLESAARQRCLELVKKITYIELNVNQEFMLRFSGSRFIPHTEHALFPSVPFFDGE